MVLARVLNKFLEADAFEKILKSVLELEETRLVAEYGKAPQDTKILEQIEVDKAHYVEKISTISGGLPVGQVFQRKTVNSQ